MSWNPNLIFYACIAKDATILAEFNSKDADLGDLAKRCLEKTPSLHSHFFHTVHGRTYMFFIHDPFVYFGIFDENLDKQECLSFLRSVKDSFDNGSNSGTSKKRLDSMNSHCFQGEFNPVFHQLLGSNSEFDMMASPRVLDNNESVDSVGKRKKKSGTLPLIGVPSPMGLTLKMKKRFFGGESNKGGLKDSKLDVLSDEETSDSCRLQKAKLVWKKQAAVVLSMDLVVCLFLFMIWLWVCSGFQCIARN